MKIKITKPGISEDGTPAFYSDHTTPLPIGEWDVELVWQWRDSRGNWFILRDSFIRNGKPTNYTTDDFDTRQIYLSPLPPAQPVKAVEEEKEMYLMLADNGDLGGLYLRDMRQVSEHIEMDLEEIEPSDRHKVQYTITPVFMTETEFINLPEYQG